MGFNFSYQWLALSLNGSFVEEKDALIQVLSEKGVHYRFHVLFANVKFYASELCLEILGQVQAVLVTFR